MNTYKPLDLEYWDIENSFYLNSHTSRIGKLLSHYEIFKSIKDVPGAIVEIGVFKGSSFVRWCTFRKLVECDDARQVYGFDAFGKFPVKNINSKEDLEFAKDHDEGSGSVIDKELLTNMLKNKNISNFELVQGDIFETIPNFLLANSHLKIALLHLDVDVYDPTLFALKSFWKHISINGLIVVDDYAAVEGATRAVDEFLANRSTEQSKAAFYHVPTVFRKTND